MKASCFIVMQKATIIYLLTKTVLKVKQLERNVALCKSNKTREKRKYSVTTRLTSQNYNGRNTIDAFFLNLSNHDYYYLRFCGTDYQIVIFCVAYYASIYFVTHTLLKYYFIIEKNQ